MSRAGMLLSVCSGAVMTMAAPTFAAGNVALTDIIVTATKRAEPLSRVPVAVSAVSAESLRMTGATDIRDMVQLASPLFVSSTSSESNGAVVRIRGIGTIGDNPGLEASVPVFIDGVYRSRSGTALTELGDVERVEVLRGPQGTLFGRNASAGLINIETKRPSFTPEGNASLTYGNYNHWRATGNITGSILDDKLATRLDALYISRRGFMTETNSGRHPNGRDRFLLRGQLLFVPSDDITVRFIADYAKRDEECCAAPYLPVRATVRDASGQLQRLPTNPVADLVRSLGGIIHDNPYERKTALTPGRSFRSNVRDWGLSAQLDWDLGAVSLTSITAWRDWKVDAQQDADFSSLDLIARDNFDRHFRTFSEELRLNGTLFDDRVDWLVGAYYAHEKLNYEDDLHFGMDYMDYANGLVRLQNPTFPGFDAIAALIGQPGDTLNGRGQHDRFRHTSRNYAFFTHNVVHVTDQLLLTLGGRYTNEKKTVDLNLRGNNTLCGGIAQSSIPSVQALASAACAVNPILSLDGSRTRKDSEFTGTAVIAYRPTERLMVYGSYAKGYKAGGFNLDRAGLDPANVSLETLEFAPEKANSFEVGAKLSLDRFQLNVAGFHTIYSNFQLNTFNGVNFVVENIQSCKTDLDPAGNCTGKTRGGVTSSGVEVDAVIRPVNDVTFHLGMEYARTRYRSRLVGAGGRQIPPALILLPGQQMSNAPEYTLTGAATWTPEVNDQLRALFHVDFRFQSGYNTGSDLFAEKWQPAYLLMNARIGVNSQDDRWSLELWARNLLDKNYMQTGFNAPLQGSGSAAITAINGTPATTLFGGFLGDPRTYGVTVRTRF